MSKNAIVIGATSGIGRSVAECLVAHGYRVGIMGRRIELLQEMEQAAPGSFVAMQMDVMQLEQSVEQLKKLIARLGDLDLLMINSGIGDLDRELDFAIERRTIETNVLGMTNLAVYGTHYFINRKAGHLVLMSSVASIRGSKIAPAYNASKAFISNYAEGLRQKVNGLPITVTDIRPGFVDTALGQTYPIHFWLSTPDEAAADIYKAICKKKKIAYISGRWKWAAYMMRLIPAGVYCRMGKRLQ